MGKSDKIDDRRADLTHVRGQAVRAQLRPVHSARPAERRNCPTRRALVRRVHGEFVEMPGLVLSIEQAARLFSLPSSVCARVFDELIEGNFVRLTTGGRYALLNKSRPGGD